MKTKRKTTRILTNARAIQLNLKTKKTTAQREHEAITNDHHEDTKDDEDKGYTSHDDEDETSVFRNADNGFEVRYDAEVVVVVISVCSDDHVRFQARPTQAHMDMIRRCLANRLSDGRGVPISEFPVVTSLRYKSIFAITHEI